MRSTTAIIVAMTVFSVSRISAETVRIQAEGRAPASMATCREQALSEALAEAVREGAGVSIRSSEKMADFELDYSRVFVLAMGYVRSYRVIDSTVDHKGGIYSVRIEAEVEGGAPGLNDRLALLQLARLKGSPKISVAANQNIRNIDIDLTQTLAARLRERASELGLRVMRENDTGDYLIQANIGGSYLGSKEIHGIEKPSLLLELDISAVNQGNNEIVAHVNYPEKKVLSTFTEQPEFAFRISLDQILDGSSSSGYKSLDTVFHRIFLQWLVETDLGSIIRVEIADVGIEQLNRTVAKLADTKNVSNVWIKNFQSRGTSVIEVETRLSPTALGEHVLLGLGGGHEIKGFSPQSLTLQKKTYFFLILSAVVLFGSLGVSTILLFKTITKRN